MQDELLPLHFYRHPHVSNFLMNTCRSEAPFDEVSLGSDKYIACVENVSTNTPRVRIFDLVNPEVPSTYCHLPGKNAIMNPSEKIVACKVGDTLRVVDVRTSTTIKQHKQEDDVIFWRWISDDVVVFVTEEAVHRWNIRDEFEPEWWFWKHESLKGRRIVDLQTGWGADALIADTEGGCTAGCIQLYCENTKLSQPLAGDAACFIQFKMEENEHPSKLFVSSRRNQEGGKVIIMEVGTRLNDNQPYTKKTVDVPYWPGFSDDYPTFMTASSRQGVVYLTTNRGFLHILDLSSGEIIYWRRMFEHPILRVAEQSEEGFVALDGTGQVFSVSIDKAKMSEYQKQKKTAEVVLELMHECDPVSPPSDEDSSSDSGRESDTNSTHTRSSSLFSLDSTSSHNPLEELTEATLTNLSIRGEMAVRYRAHLQRGETEETLLDEEEEEAIVIRL